MKKNQLRAVVFVNAFAASATAFAQGTFVQIYGMFNADLEYAQAVDPSVVPIGVSSINGAPTIFGPALNGATRPLGSGPLNASIPGQFGISSNSSQLGFRGSEDLGNGFLAIFQVESSINLDTGNGNLGGRNSNLGLETPWGVIFYGNWDTAYKSVRYPADPFYASGSPNFNSVFGSPGFNIQSIGPAAAPPPTGLTNNADAAGFDRRQTNSVQYWTPNLGGFYGRFQYAPGEQKGTFVPLGYTAAQVQGVNPWMWSAGLFYDHGPIYAALGYEQHKDYFGARVFTGQTLATGSSSNDWGAQAVIGAQKVLGGLSVYGVFERLKYSTDGVVATGQLTDYRRDAYGVMGTYALGNVILRAGWMQGGNPSCSAVRAVCLDDSLGTNQYSLGAAYTFSKRTQVYVFWTLQANDAYARYKLGSNTGPVPNSGNATIGIGTHPQAGGLGIRHTF